MTKSVSRRGVSAVVGAARGGRRGALLAGTALTAAISLAAAGSVAAQDRTYWDGDGVGNAANGVVDGGDGVWTVNSANWTDQTGTLSGANRPVPSNLIFDGEGGTVTLDDSAGSITALGLDFRADGYVLTGDALTFSTVAGPNVISVADAATATIGTTLAAGVTTKDGGGVLILTQASTFGNALTVAEGELQSASSLSATTITVRDGATLGLVDNTFGFGGTTSSAVQLDDGATFIVDRTGGVTLSNLTGDGDVEKRGAGTLAVTGGDFNGTATVYAGTLSIDGAGMSTSYSTALADAAINLASSSAVLAVESTDIPVGVTIGSLAGVEGSRVLIGEKGLTVAGDETTTFAGTLETTEGGDLSLTGPGTLTLTADQADFGGSFFVNAGVLAFAGEASAANSFMSLQGGDLDISGIDGAATRVLTLEGSNLSTVVLGDKRLEIGITANPGDPVDGYSSEFNGTIEGTGGVDVLNGTLVLTSAHTFTGGLTVDSQGALLLRGDSTLASAVTVDGFLLVDQRTLPGTASIGGLSGTGSVRLADNLTLTGGGLFAGDLVDEANNGGGPAAAITISGGEQVVTGTFRHTGGTFLTGGDLSIGDGGVTGWVEGDIDIGAGSTLTFDRSDDIIYGDILSGVGDVVKQGEGMLTLTNQNTFSGVLTVRDGVLALGADGDISTATLVLDGGVLDLSMGGADEIQVDNLTGDAGSSFELGEADLTVENGDYAGVISGEGGLTVTGTLGLSGANTYQGGTTINDGARINLDGAGELGSGPVTVVGTLDVSGKSDDFAVGQMNGSGDVVLGDNSISLGNGQNSAFSGVISGEGGVNKVGSGEVTLIGDNTYTGGTTVTSGALIGDTGSIQGDVANAGTVVFNETDDASFGGDLSGSGLFNKTGAGELTLTGDSASDWSIGGGGLQSQTDRFSGDAAIGSGATFTFDQTQAGTYAGTLTGAGTFQVLGGGDVTLTGDSGGFSGTTSVGSGAILSINGSLGGMTNVLADGRLEGVGTLGGANVVGTIAPGNSIGTLTIDGDFTFAADGVYEVEFNDAGDSDLIVVTGTATIDGGLVEGVGSGTSFAPETRYTILTADGGVSGTFDAVTSDLAFLTPTLSYTANAVTLLLERNQVEFESIAGTRNQRAVARSAQTLPDGNAVLDAVLRLSEADARDAFDQLSGSDYASVRGGLARDSRFVRDAVLARGAMAASTGDGAWVQITGSRARIDSDDNAAEHRRDGQGVMGGVDKAFTPALRFGAVAAYGQDDIRFDDGAAQHDVDTYSLGGYAVVGSGAVTLTVGANQAWHDVDSTRAVAFPGLTQSLRGDYQLRTAQVFGEVAAGFERDGMRIQPFVGLARVRVSDGDFSETGGAAALSSEGSDQSTDYASAGIRVGSGWNVNGMGLTIDASAGARHILGDRVPVATLGFGAGDPFTVAGVPQDRTVGVVDIGAGLDVTETIRIGVSYSGQFGSNTTDHGAQARLSWRF